MQKGEVVFAKPRERGGGGKARKKPLVSKRFFQHASGTFKKCLRIDAEYVEHINMSLEPRRLLKVGAFCQFLGRGSLGRTSPTPIVGRVW